MLARNRPCVTRRLGARPAVIDGALAAVIKLPLQPDRRPDVPGQLPKCLAALVHWAVAAAASSWIVTVGHVAPAGAALGAIAMSQTIEQSSIVRSEPSASQ